MARYKPVEINKLSFAFCRYGMAIIVWLAFIFQLQILLWVAMVLFFFSALLKVQRSPMIVLANVTLCKIWKSPQILVNEHAMFFAHLVGFIFSAICLWLVRIFEGNWIWISVGIFALLKSISALGFCPAAKLYECMFNGTCCIHSKEKKCTTIL